MVTDSRSDSRVTGDAHATDGPCRVLVWGAQRVGDVVMTLPALKLLRSQIPNARLTYVTSEYARDVIEMSGLADTVWALKFRGRLGDFWKYRRLRKDVQAGRFAKILVLGKSKHYEKHVGPLAATTRSGAMSADHLVDRHVQAVLAAFGLPECPVPEVRLHLPDAAPAHEKLASLELDVRRRHVVLHPGRNRSMRRRELDKAARKGNPERVWPITSYAELARRISADFPEVALALVGAAGEREWVEKELRQHPTAPGNLVNLCGRTTVPELLHVLKHAAVLVGADSGVMHLASLVATPTVALFGPSREDESGPGPMNENAVVVRAQPLELARRNPRCMAEIDVERVYQDVKPRLVDPKA